MNLLRLGLELRLDLGFGFQSLLEVGFRPGINLVERGDQVGQHESVGIFGAEKIAPFLREVGFVALFVDGVKKLLFFRVKFLLGLVGVQLQFGLVHQTQVLRVFQNFHQLGGLGIAEFDAVKQEADLFFQRVGDSGDWSRRPAGAF